MGSYLRPLSRQDARLLDTQATAQLGVPSLILMENAGRGAAGWLAELAGIMPPSAGGRPFTALQAGAGSQFRVMTNTPAVAVLCGPGNNGGDAGVVARHLDAWGFPVRVIWFAHSSNIHGDAAVQWSILQKSQLELHAWYDVFGKSELDLTHLKRTIMAADWIVDGLFGTGLSRPVEGFGRAVIEIVNQSERPVLSLDLPSGLDADSGEPLGVAIRARATATFVAPKLGFSAQSAQEYLGEVTVIDIGLPRLLLEPFRVE